MISAGLETPGGGCGGVSRLDCVPTPMEVFNGVSCWSFGCDSELDFAGSAVRALAWVTSVLAASIALASD